MSTVALKLTSLLIRTLSKPVSNYIKRQAREHPPFRRVCVQFAQGLHRIDMRMRLGLLQDPAVIERQIAREVEKAAEARRVEEAKASVTSPTEISKNSYDVPTEEQAHAEEKAKKKDLTEAEEKVRKEEKERRARIKIRPLSEAKAIDSGANFLSEAFLFLVAGGLIVFESWRSRRKEVKRRDEVQERLDKLEEREQELEGVRFQLAKIQARFEEAANAPQSERAAPGPAPKVVSAKPPVAS